MKKIVLGILAVVLTVSAMAQTSGNGTDRNNRDRKEHRGKQFKDAENFNKLNLTEAQKAEIKTINEGFKQQMQDLHKQGSITVDEQKQKRQALMETRKQKLESVLTPEQRKQAEAFAEEFKAGRNMRQDRFGDLTKDLDLTPEQSEKMTAINSAFKTNLQNIRTNKSLTQDEKREQMKNLMKQHKSDMEALLTNDQKEQLKNRQKNRSNSAAVK